MIRNDDLQKWYEINKRSSSDTKMNAFLSGGSDTYAILQLKYSDDTRYERFISLNELYKENKQPDIDHYEVVYVAPLPPYKNMIVMLEGLYKKFNIDHPKDFRWHSLSVSDVVAIKENGMVSCHYVDTVGFKQLDGFLDTENYLKNAEMSMEDDLNMIDGIINNGRSDSVKETAVKRSSVLVQLKADVQKRSSGKDTIKKQETGRGM